MSTRLRVRALLCVPFLAAVLLPAGTVAASPGGDTSGAGGAGPGDSSGTLVASSARSARAATARSGDPSAATATPAPLANGTPLMDTTSLYPRAIRLEHSGEANGTIIAGVVTFTDQGGVGAIFESTDDGRSFQRIGSIPASEQAGTPGLCCASIFELPRQIGDMPAGTLLWAGSVGQDAEDRRMTQRVWKSDDHGRTWTYLSTCAESPNTRGMWEPEFSVDAQGRLVCHFADETEGEEGSQQLARAVSTDGVTWGPKQVTVASRPELFRPGMPVVRRLPSGEYLMVYEICGIPGQYDCAVYTRTSPDGADWGDPTDPGTQIFAESGRYFTHTPTITLLPQADGSADVLLVGQLLENPDGSTADGNGATLMLSENGGNGPWRELEAPVQVPDAWNNYCPNYSSTLLPTDGGRSVLEIATDYDENGVCRAYFATGPLG